MRGSWALILLATVVGCGKEGKPGDPPAPAPKPIVLTEDELKRLAGDWKVVKVEGGEQRDKEAIVTFRGNHVTFEQGQNPPSLRFQVDPNQDPKWFDLFVPLDEPERPLPGIYELDGDKLTLYLITEVRSDRPPERPKDFRDKHPGQILHLERVRK